MKYQCTLSYLTPGGKTKDVTVTVTRYGGEDLLLLALAEANRNRRGRKIQYQAVYSCVSKPLTEN